MTPYLRPPSRGVQAVADLFTAHGPLTCEQVAIRLGLTVPNAKHRIREGMTVGLFARIGTAPRGDGTKRTLLTYGHAADAPEFAQPDEDHEAPEPVERRPSPDAVVRMALETQPRSVFELGRCAG